MKNGFVELLALRVLSLPLEIGLCFLGIRFVLRNKVDVPKWVKPKVKKESKKDKERKEKARAAGEEGDDDALSDDEDDEETGNADGDSRKD